MKRRSANDDWPERIGVPALKTALTHLEFVAGCLSDSDPVQMDARFHVLKAVEQTQKALKEFEP